MTAEQTAPPSVSSIADQEIIHVAARCQRLDDPFGFAPASCPSLRGVRRIAIFGRDGLLFLGGFRAIAEQLGHVETLGFSQCSQFRLYSLFLRFFLLGDFGRDHRSNDRRNIFLAHQSGSFSVGETHLVEDGIRFDSFIEIYTAA